MARAKQNIRESIRLSSEVTIIVEAAPAVYDTLNIQRVGGMVVVALPGAAAPQALAPQMPYMPAPDTPDIAAARRRLEERHAKPVLTAGDLAASAGFDTAKIEQTLAGAMNEAPPLGSSNEEN